MTAYIEVAASWLFQNYRHRDDKLITTHAAFSQHPKPTLHVTSPDCGADGSTMGPAYMSGGGGRIPALEWEDVEGVREWVLVSEDADAPLPTPICHGLYVGIPRGKRSVVAGDFERVDETSTRLKGGFWYGKSRNWSVYIPPRPLMNHGPHRYFFEVVALKEPLDAAFVASKPSLEAVAREMEGKVLAWGQWIGQCERRWE